MGEVGHAIYAGGFRPFWTQAAIQSHPYVYTQIKLLQGDACAHKCSYTGRGLRTEMVWKKYFTKGCFYSQALLHRDVFNTEIPLHTGALGGKYFYTETILQRESFRRKHVYTQVPLHRYAFTHSRFYALMGLRGAVTYKFFCVEIVLCASTFTHTYLDTHWQVFYTQILCTVMFFRIQVLSRTCRHACSFTGMSLNAHASTQRYFHTKILLHTFTQRFACTEMPSHTEIILRWGTLPTRCHYKQRCFRKQAFTRGAFTYGRFYTDILLHDIRRRAPILRERVQQTGTKPEFHHSSWWSRHILC